MDQGAAAVWWKATTTNEAAVSSSPTNRNKTKPLKLICNSNQQTNEQSVGNKKKNFEADLQQQQTKQTAEKINLNTGIFLKNKMSTTTNKHWFWGKKKRKILKLKCNKQTNKEQWKEIVKQLLHLHTGSSNCIFRFISRWGKSWGVWCKQELCCCVEVVQLPWITDHGCVCCQTKEVRKGFLWESLLGLIRLNV